MYISYSIIIGNQQIIFKNKNMSTKGRNAWIFFLIF